MFTFAFYSAVTDKMENISTLLVGLRILLLNPPIRHKTHLLKKKKKKKKKNEGALGMTLNHTWW